MSTATAAPTSSQDSAGEVFVRLSTGAGFGAEALWHGWFAP